MKKNRCDYCGDLLYPKNGWLYCKTENIYYCPSCGEELEIETDGFNCQCGYTTDKEIIEANKRYDERAKKKIECHECNEKHDETCGFFVGDKFICDYCCQAAELKARNLLWELQMKKINLTEGEYEMKKIEEIDVDFFEKELIFKDKNPLLYIRYMVGEIADRLNQIIKRINENETP